jgi:DNA primase
VRKMAKTYLNTIKYEIKAKYEITGVVEKPDIVGAIFGQSEGMLGSDMDLKDLQQAGKIGRIEISVNKAKGKTYGDIIVPSSLDQVKTSILAATIETVEKVGPCEANVKIISIRDTRKEKREQITDRAKQLLQKMQKFESVESSELSDNLKSSIRTEKAINYKGMTAGPEVLSSKQIIVVEGRADVLKLLSYGINNAIEMNGSNITKDLEKLCREKEVIVLIDGDRGGDLNAKKLASLTDIEYVAKAPDGKEVEELTQKEILISLKRRQTLRDFNNPHKHSNNRDNYNRNDRRGNTHGNYRNDRRGSYNNRRDTRSNNRYSRDGDFRERFDPFKNNYRRSTTKNPTQNRVEEKDSRAPIKENTLNVSNFSNDFEKIKGKKKARLFDEKNKKIKDVAVKDLADALSKSRKKINTILMDGIVTKRLAETAKENNIKNIIGIRKSNFKNNDINIGIIKK